MMADHSGLGQRYLLGHPDVPIIHDLDEPCAWCDPIPDPWDCAQGDDPLGPARGMALGSLLGCLAWVAIWGGAAVVLSRLLY